MFLANNQPIVKPQFFLFLFFLFEYQKIQQPFNGCSQILIIQRFASKSYCMNFLLNPNPLPINKIQKKMESLQYYQWRYKQRLHQQEQQLKKLKKFQKLIQKEEEKQNRQNLCKKRMHHHGSFYDYNIEWKKKVDERINQQKNQKLMELSKHQQKAMKSQLNQPKKQLSCGYKGPIQGWQKHFENYLKSKSSGLILNNQQLTFEPKINQRSRKMAEGMTGKVQDRLILFGEFVKIKNQSQMNKSQNQNEINNTNHQKYSSNYSNQSQLFYRLYKEGEQANKRRRELALNESHTFQPKLNKLPEQIEDKIIKRRKPLYYNKNSISNSNSEQNLQQQKQTKVKGDFESFLKRNQALLDMKKKMMLALRQKQEQRQNIQKSQCTFTPVLNQNSKRIQKNLQQTNKAFQQKMMKQIDRIYQTQAQPQVIVQPQHTLQNIEISKLTQVKDIERMDESDSIYLFKIETQHKMVKRKQFDSGNAEIVVQKQLRIQGISRISQKIVEQKSSNNHPSTDITGNNEQDSIEKMKNSQWQSEMEQIQYNIQNMMTRTNK